MKDEVTLTVREELFIMQMAEQQDVQEPTLLEDIKLPWILVSKNLIV